MSIGYAPISANNANFNLNNSLATLDIVGHEYTHGVVQFTAGLSGGEASTLNEGIADIFGTALERSLLADWNWTLAEDA